VKADAVEVDHPWETVVRTADQPDRTLPPDQKIVDVFDVMKGAFLILGAPGSGKTTTLLELARELIARVEKDSTLPIPVVFNLSSWAQERKTVAEWLVDELKTKYGVPSKMGRQWVEHNDLILLLDGLDEVRSEHRRACVDAINKFRPEHGLTGIVVCSRTKEYEELASRLKLNGAVLIQPLTREQIDRYIAARGSQLATLRSAMRIDVMLQELAEVPLTLSIMSLAYSDQSVDSLTFVKDDLAQHRKHLFNAYVDKMFDRTARTANKEYPKGDTVHWLAWLAARMSGHGQTVFLIEQMQPSWLQSHDQLKMYSIGFGLIMGLVWGLLGVVVVELLIKRVAGQAVGLAGEMAGALVYGLYGALVSGLYGARRNIKPVESLKLSRPLLEVGLLVGLGCMLVFGLIWGLLVGLIFGLGVSLLTGLVSGLVYGLRVPQIETKTKSNQGIWLSGRNALLIGLCGLVLGLVLGPVGGLIDGLARGLLGGLYIGLCFGLLFGGLACIQHFTLRFIMWRNGDMPWNYARFLDYAAERIFLRKVGGGYIFIHRTFLEYFASLETQPSAESGE
jgi:hypothetical protein